LLPYFGSLFLLAAAHSAPWAAGRALGKRWAHPIDGGRTLGGRRLLGDHKTWRGLLAGILACAVIAPLIGYSVRLGIEFAALALLGDAISSVAKRRMRRPPGTEIPGLDQIPEALFPLLLLSTRLGIGVAGASLVAGAFVLLDLAAMPLRHGRRRS